MTFERLVREFWETYRKEISFNYWNTYDIVASLFKGIKDNMSSGNFEDIRIKYLGLFKINRGRILYYSINNIKRYEKGLIDKKAFKDYMVPIYHFLKREKDNYNDFYKEKCLYIIKYCEDAKII